MHQETVPKLPIHTSQKKNHCLPTKIGSIQMRAQAEVNTQSEIIVLIPDTGVY
jgi:hypothetical protein